MREITGSRFLQAARRESVDATPVWFMRQAGRYMPEYRAIRAKMSMLEALRTPAIAAEITLQPIEAFALDAAIIFCDILLPLIGMGLDLDFVAGEGPHIDQPIRTAADIDRLITPAAAETMPYALEAIRLVVESLTPRGIPLIGFAGAPFTLACYAIEGGGSQSFAIAKKLMYNAPEAWHGLLDKLAIVVADFLIAQAQAGASALKLFDPWVGALSSADYNRFAAPHTQKVIDLIRSTGVPLILFSTGTTGHLADLAKHETDVIGVDWRMPLDQAWAGIGAKQAIQGNLDPMILATAPWEEIRAQTDLILAQAGGRPGHIFNLGHGILPETPVDHVRRLIDYVHDCHGN